MQVSRTTSDSPLLLGFYDQSPVTRVKDICSRFDEIHQSTESLALVTLGFGASDIAMDSRNGIPFLCFTIAEYQPKNGALGRWIVGVSILSLKSPALCSLRGSRCVSTEKQQV
mgnify:CR=1 FL=1